MTICARSRRRCRNRSRRPGGASPVLPVGDAPPAERCDKLSPINQRRWDNFKANKRGYWSLRIFLALFVVSLFAEFIANDRPLVVSYKGELLLPVLIDLSGIEVRRLPRRHRLQGPGDPRRDQGERLGHLAADPLLLRHHQQGLPGPQEARTGCASAFRRPRRGRRARRFAMRRPTSSRASTRSATPTGSASTTRAATSSRASIYGFRISVLFGLLLTTFSSVGRRRGRRRAGLFRRPDRPHLPALPGDLVVDARRCSC